MEKTGFIENTCRQVFKTGLLMENGTVLGSKISYCFRQHVEQIEILETMI